MWHTNIPRYLLNSNKNIMCTGTGWIYTLLKWTDWGRDKWERWERSWQMEEFINSRIVSGEGNRIQCLKEPGIVFFNLWEEQLVLDSNLKTSKVRSWLELLFFDKQEGRIASWANTWYSQSLAYRSGWVSMEEWVLKITVVLDPACREGTRAERGCV